MADAFLAHSSEVTIADSVGWGFDSPRAEASDISLKEREAYMSKREESKKPSTGSEQISRRESGKKLAKMAYVVPAILSVVKTTERPAFAQSGLPTMAPPTMAPPTIPPPQ